MTKRKAKASATPDPDGPPPLGNCRIATCGNPTWMADEVGPVHPCCLLWEAVAPGVRCLACRSGDHRR